MNTIKTEDKNKIKQGYKKTSIGIIPEDWEEMRLEQVSKIIMGVSPNSENYNFEGQGKFLIQGNADIRNRKSAPRQYTSEITKECQVGDILMSVRAPVGEIAKSIHNACIGRGVCAIRNNKKADGEFLFYYLLNTEVLWSRFKQGSTFESVNSTDIRNFTIQIPPIQEQKAIADCLSTWDSGIEKLSALIASKKEQKKGLMQGLFSGELKVENGELIQAKDGEDFTKEWGKMRLGEILEESKIISEENDKSKRISVRLHLEGVHKRPVRGTEADSTTFYKRKSGQFIYGKQNFHNGSLGIIPEEFDGFETTSDLPSFNINNKVNHNWFFYYISRFDFYSKMESKTTGTGSKRLHPRELFSTKIPKPSIEEQTAIAEVLTTADKEIELLEQKLEAFKIQKKGLMQILLTGKKRLL